MLPSSTGSKSSSINPYFGDQDIHGILAHSCVCSGWQQCGTWMLEVIVCYKAKLREAMADQLRSLASRSGDVGHLQDAIPVFVRCASLFSPFFLLLVFKS